MTENSRLEKIVEYDAMCEQGNILRAQILEKEYESNDPAVIESCMLKRAKLENLLSRVDANDLTSIKKLNKYLVGKIT